MVIFNLFNFLEGIDESLKNGSCVVPCSYEILGCLDNKRDETDEAVPGIARLNKETGVSLHIFRQNIETVPQVSLNVIHYLINLLEPRTLGRILLLPLQKLVATPQDP